MGQKVNPISNRLGIIRGWDSNWFGGKDFGDNLVEDALPVRVSSLVKVALMSTN